MINSHVQVNTEITFMVDQDNQRVDKLFKLKDE